MATAAVTPISCRETLSTSYSSSVSQKQTNKSHQCRSQFSKSAALQSRHRGRSCLSRARAVVARAEGSAGRNRAVSPTRAVASAGEAETSTRPTDSQQAAGSSTWDQMEAAYTNYATGYRSASLDAELSQWVEAGDIQGEIPKELVGTLLRNGPALFERTGEDGKEKRRVYLDGDGMVFSLALKDGKAYFRNKFVRTPSFVRETEAGTFTDLSIFTAEDPRAGPDTGPTPLFRLRDDIFNGPPSPKANGAYNVVNWAGSLCAIDWGQPHGLSNSLDYEGKREGDEFSNAEFTAHYRILKEADGSRRMVTFEPKVDWAKGITTCTFKEFDEEGHCQQTREHIFPATYFHDMIVTENFYVLFDCPVKMDMFKTFIGYPFGKCSLGETISEDLNKRGVFRIFPRRDGVGREAVIQADEVPAFAFHHINGYDMLNAVGENKKNQIVFETCTWDRMCLYFNDIIKADGKTHWPRTKLSRFVIDLDTQSCERTIVSEKACEYPIVAPSATGVPHHYSYLVSNNRHFDDPKRGRINGPMQILEKLTYEYEADGTTIKELKRDPWNPGEAKFAMEPLFVPKPNSSAEDDGWLVVPVYNSETTLTEVAILDAANWEDPLLANVKLPTYIPHGVHGSFSEEYICGPDKTN
mmetsp:Transcript_19531/g.23418  ORF Transcript_19531/g.23418 Transcript_19531/m.23418 type:complete len:640 (-) Transcript_19531:272-2191(-)|eukprot:CAMPEP_0197855234 /NCGR_PEP_ID=MMETSP1438-20131217/26222_1 /TAXON_ID=1461541 /ORGANISM="Pterosperma sp., Strain CCMP1384" /LENGTH=639 /DNA_ID=CAMNT_0043470267 /DNA_START=171 /DNA_END=2090 /DNA_ORIENTATION=+